MARPTKFTPERSARFLLALAAGSFPEVAARHAGWSVASMYRFLAGETPERVAFRDEVVRVETELELRLSGTLTQAAFHDPRLAVTVLERRFAARWSRRARFAVPSAEAPDEAGRPEETVVLDPAFVDEVVSKLLEARAKLRAGSANRADRVRRFEDRGDRPGADDEGSSER
jgi:hypothetical protein